MREIFVGRQPIFDRKLGVFAYELLFRGGEDNRADFHDGDQATSQLIMNTFMEMGLQHIVDEHLAFINLTRDFIMSDGALNLPPDKVVLEFLEHIPVNDQILRAVERLVAGGYTIALDDFIYREDLRPLVDYASIIKIDLRALDREAVGDHVRLLRTRPLKLLAEKVETQEEFEFCKQLGFDYFQGFFLSRPTIVKGRRPPANRLVALRLLAKLQDPKVQITEINDLISQDISLAYRVLRYINSAYFNLNRKVDSIQNALQLLGLSHLKRLAALIALSQIDDKPHELFITALVRAKMCEQYAEALGDQAKDTYFTVGMFSTLEALLDLPMGEVLASLPLSEEICEAILEHRDQAGAVLRSVLAYERGDWEQVPITGIDDAMIRQIYLESLAWADHTAQSLLG